MVTCPKCKAENRPEAAFCSTCGTILFAQPAPAKIEEQSLELNPVPAAIASAAPQPSSAPVMMAETLQTRVEPVYIKPEPAMPSMLPALKDGSVLADRFQYQDLVSQGEHANYYRVTEMIQPGAPSVRVCSNPECRTIHCPVGPDPEKFCTQCGSALEDRSQFFLLQEADADNYSYVKHVLELHLVHPNIHPPLAAFQQDSEGSARFYMVTPYSADLPGQLEISEVLDWGVQLAGALDYLQSKGVILGDEVSSASIGLVEGKAVWRDFTGVRVLPLLTDREKINNLRLLGIVMYGLMTGSTNYSMDPYLPSALNDLFEKALIGEGFTSGAEFIQQIELAKSGRIHRLALDYQVGRRSHTGIVREINEDSLLALELSTIHQDEIRPCGIFAIADGMGGHSAGDFASGLVINTITQKSLDDLASLQDPAFKNHEDWLKGTLQAANLAVYEARQNLGNDMGSTVVLCLLMGAQAYLTHQGDSRIYLVNQNGIQQLTTDHSLVQHMVSTGQISQDEARYHPQRNVIYRSLGDKPYVEVECLTQQLFPHDRLLLCSDGLTNLLDNASLQKIVLESCSPQEACDKLIEAANAVGGDDNITAIVIEVIPV